jgi:hypothetical protein
MRSCITHKERMELQRRFTAALTAVDQNGVVGSLDTPEAVALEHEMEKNSHGHKQWINRPTQRHLIFTVLCSTNDHADTPVAQHWIREMAELDRITGCRVRRHTFPALSGLCFFQQCSKETQKLLITKPQALSPMIAHFEKWRDLAEQHFGDFVRGLCNCRPVDVVETRTVDHYPRYSVTSSLRHPEIFRFLTDHFQRFVNCVVKKRRGHYKMKQVLQYNVYVLSVCTTILREHLTDAMCMDLATMVADCQCWTRIVPMHAWARVVNMGFEMTEKSVDCVMSGCSVDIANLREVDIFAARLLDRGMVPAFFRRDYDDFWLHWISHETHNKFLGVVGLDTLDAHVIAIRYRDYPDWFADDNEKLRIAWRAVFECFPYLFPGRMRGDKEYSLDDYEIEHTPQQRQKLRITLVDAP